MTYLLLKKTFHFLLIMTVSLVLASCSTLTGDVAAESSAALDEVDSVPPTSTIDNTSVVSHDADAYGAAGALSDADLTMQDMLNYALQDEYLARAEYQAVLDAFGSQRPFSNIIKAEENHISKLLPLFSDYNITPAQDTSASYLMLPASISDALQIGVQAEISNIDMYDLFLDQELPDDVKAVFVELRDASQSHLSAFQRGANR